MVSKYIWIKKQRYYLYQTYSNPQKALKEAKKHKQKNGCRYFIIKEEHGLWIPEIRYLLYLNKCMRLW